MMQPEQLPKQAKTKLERRESIFNTVQKEYELKDSDGKIMCRVIVELTRNVERLDRQNGLVEVQHVNKLTLMGEKDGKQTELDLLAFARDIDPEIEVLTEAKRNTVDSAFFAPYFHRIVLKELDTPEGILSFLHELGHAAQKKEKRFADMSTADKGRRFRSPEELETTLYIISESLKIHPNEQQLRALETQKALVEDRRKIFQELLEIKYYLEAPSHSGTSPERHLSEIKQFEERQRVLEQERDRLYRIEDEVLKPLEPLLSLPQKINERNATARALVWARGFRQSHGIDLLRPHGPAASLTRIANSYSDYLRSMPEALKAIVDKSPRDAEKIVNQMISSGMSIYEEFNALLKSRLRRRASKNLTDFALGTYKADTRTMRRTYGRTPSPKELDSEILGREDIKYND